MISRLLDLLAGGPAKSFEVPLPDALVARVSAFDDYAEAMVQSRLRGHKSLDVIMYAATAVGDHGAVWMTLAAVQAVRKPEEAKLRLGRAVGGLVVESVLVNGPVKWVFARPRPTHDGPRPLYMRQPRTSSFPSGHASAAFFAAALLREDDQWWPFYYVLAVVVALSRMHVKIHHASDVVGGMVIGALLGELTRKLLPRRIPSSRGGSGNQRTVRPR